MGAVRLRGRRGLRAFTRSDAAIAEYIAAHIHSLCSHAVDRALARLEERLNLSLYPRRTASAEACNQTDKTVPTPRLSRAFLDELLQELCSTLDATRSSIRLLDVAGAETVRRTEKGSASGGRSPLDWGTAFGPPTAARRFYFVHLYLGILQGIREEAAKVYADLGGNAGLYAAEYRLALIHQYLDWITFEGKPELGARIEALCRMSIPLRQTFDS